MGQVVLISGGTSGIGKRSAELFAAGGYQVAILGRDAIKGQQAAESLQQSYPPTKILYIQGDVSKVEDCTKAVAQTVQWGGSLDVLINSAGRYFEKALEDMDIIHHRIRVATPRHNGKVERQHRTDENRFYKKMRMYSLEDGRKQLTRYNKKSNNIPKICLNFRTPNEVLNDYLAVM